MEMKLQATYVVRFKITDRSLYDEFDSGDGTLVRFLSEVLSTVRYAEDWNKRVMETFSDEYWWDDEADEGIIDVEVTFNTEGLPESSHDGIMESIGMTTGDDMPPFKYINKEMLALLCCTQHQDGMGPLAATVWWSTLIPETEDDDGDLFREEDYPGAEEFKGRIVNYPNTTVQLLSVTFNNGTKEDIELEGSFNSETTNKELEDQMTEYYPEFK